MNPVEVAHVLIVVWLAVPLGVIAALVACHLRDRLRAADQLIARIVDNEAPRPVIPSPRPAGDDIEALADAVRDHFADERLIERIVAGDEIPDDELARHLAAWRDQVKRDDR